MVVIIYSCGDWSSSMFNLVKGTTEDMAANCVRLSTGKMMTTQLDIFFSSLTCGYIDDLATFFLTNDAIRNGHQNFEKSCGILRNDQ